SERAVSRRAMAPCLAMPAPSGRGVAFGKQVETVPTTARHALSALRDKSVLRYAGKMRTLGAVVVVVLWAGSGVARAQYRNPYNNMTWNNVFSRNVDMFNSMNQNLMNQMNRINASR